MPKVLVHHARFAPEHAPIADRCPQCDADFTKPRALRRWAYVHQAELGHLRPDPDPTRTFASDDRLVEGTDYLYAFAYHCEACGYEVIDTAVTP